MTDLLASTASISLAAPVAGRTRAVVAPGGFDLNLAIADRATATLPGGKPPATAIAGSGKFLPGGDADSDGDGATGTTDDDADPDALLAWMPGGLALLPVETPPPAPLTLTPRQGGTPADPVAAALPADPAALAGADPATAADAAIDSLAAADVGPDGAPKGAADLISLRTWRDPVPAKAEPVARGGVTVAGGRDAASATVPLASVSAPAAAAQHAASAAQVFAAALATASEPARAPTDPTGLESQLLRQVEAQRTSVQATAATDQAPLDLSRDDWTGKMIDRIAVLRDGVEAADTRIRLAPEHLGNVDIALRRDGDRIHVQFTAENPATRQLLTDAAPRLAELAEQRGIKLGQSSVDAGTGDQRQAPQHQPSTPARPASARATGDPASDARVA